MTGTQILEQFGEEAVVAGFRRFYSQAKWQSLLPDFEKAVSFTRQMKGI